MLLFQMEPLFVICLYGVGALDAFSCI
uniref:Uncharacterized protein n=1 Tax=Anguilla anguilla TaxID=7936 RepID=A0A0E9RDB2_ANGAN